MAMTPLVLVFLGALATIATIGCFMRLDPVVNTFLPFVAAILWGATGLGAFDVTVTNSQPVRSEPILPLAFLGIGFAMAMGVYGVWALMNGAASSVSDVEPREFGR